MTGCFDVKSATASACDDEDALNQDVTLGSFLKNS